MTNSYRNKNITGAATLIITVILLVVATLIIIFAGNYGITQEKATANSVASNDAFAAAEAGLEFGINYLKDNSATVLANPVSGFINFSNSSTTNVVLANNSSFSVVYTNPVAGNYNLIKITATGVSQNNAATTIVSQLTEWGSVLAAPGTTPLVAQGAISMTGNSQVKNTSNNNTITSGSTVTLSGSSSTALNGGTSSTPGSIQSDIQTNNGGIGTISQSDFFATFFGNTSDKVQGSMAHVYSNSSSTNYSSTLNGMTGTSVWITQPGGTTATINGSTTIGSAANPVLLIVNGNLTLSGNITIYGYVFVFGSNTIESISGNVQIIGGLATSGSLSMAGSTTLTMDTSTLSNLQNSASLRYFAKVPGSWKDF